MPYWNSAGEGRTNGRRREGGMEEQFVPCSIANVNVMRERARRSAGGREVSINSSAIHCSIAAGYTNERSEGGKSSEALRARSLVFSSSSHSAVPSSHKCRRNVGNFRWREIRGNDSSECSDRFTGIRCCQEEDGPGMGRTAGQMGGQKTS